ncbi:HAD-IC family P-type ATPase [Candidatus Berkelbacteria bacterium]|nr:HAD-IC family P-type ATPase [Candidatus Berkelbacteria bacterium]
MEKPWALPSERIVSELSSDIHHGLSQPVAKSRLSKYGYNELKTKSGIGAATVLSRQFKSPLVLILIFASVIAFIQNEPTDATVILIVVIANSLIGFFQEFRAEKTMAKLRHILAPQARVIRETQIQKINAKLLVLGDIVKLEAGDRVPADMRIIESQNLRINQASLTGESVPVIKKSNLLSSATELIDRSNMAYMSTLVVSGQGVGIVIGTGMKTELGEITREVSDTADTLPTLNKQINQLGKFLLFAAIILAATVLITGIAKQISVEVMTSVTISLLVSMVPEGLPIALTVILSLGLLGIYRKNALVRQLSAAETLGSATVICVDKTGTITEGALMAEKLYVAGTEITVDGKGYALSGNFSVEGKNIDVVKQTAPRMLLELLSLSTMSTISKKDLTNDETKALSDPTETALAVVAAKAGFYSFKQEEKYPELLEIPFDQDLRYSTSVHKFGKVNRYITKGAAEKIIDMSDFVVGADGKVKRLLAQTKAQLIAKAEEFAGRGYKVTALGFVDRPGSETLKTSSVNGLTIVGIVALSDPIRSDAKSIIAKANKAGIRVIMITGDHLLTAKTIAERIGLKGKVVHASDIARSDLKEIGVISRATPKEKLIIIDRLQKQGEIVAMTGDGVNDAPALKKADIGVAMGRGGTDVAIEASDMVLLNDQFASIVYAIERGRLIWENLRKVIFYLVSTSVAEALIIIVSIILEMPLPLIAVQILWMNLATDGITSLSLTAEEAESDLMQQLPRSPKERILTKRDFARMLLLTAIMAIGTIWLYDLTLPQGEQYARTVALTAMVFFQLFNVLNCRSAVRSVFSPHSAFNKTLFITLILAVLSQFAAIFHPLGQKYLYTTALDWPMIALIVTVSLSIVGVEEVRKLIARLFSVWAHSHVMELKAKRVD